MTRVEAGWAYSVTYYVGIEWGCLGGQAGKTLDIHSGLHINDLRGSSDTAIGHRPPFGTALVRISLVIESYIDLTLCHGYIGKDTSS